MERTTMKSQVLAILNDGGWHGCGDFIHVGLSYRNRLSELRAEGYLIESVRDGNHPTYRYRLIGRNSQPWDAPKETPATQPAHAQTQAALPF